jgi:hypothetical protein
MCAALVCIGQRWQVEATGVIVADFLEIINPQTMTARMFIEGVVVEEYKVEQCDKCSQLRKFDKFGYQKGYDRTDNIIWFCGDCR